MTSSSPHQALLAERLDDARSARRILLRAPAGCGLRTTLVPIIREAAAAGLVLIVSPARTLLDQWAARLLDAGTVARLVTPETALELADRSPTGPPTGVLLATQASIHRGPAKVALQSVDVALFLLDSSALFEDAAPSIVPGLVERAERTIVVDEAGTGTAPTWLAAPVVVELTLDEVMALREDSGIDVVAHTVAISPAERAILDQAAMLLNKPPARHSRAALHSGLMRLISGAAAGGHGDADEVDHAWRIVDQLEGLGPDARLAVAANIARSMRETGPVLVVTSSLRAEADYVLDYLISSGIEAILWTRNALPHSQWGSSTLSGPPFPVIVTTPGGFDIDDRRLRGSNLIYFSEPQSDGERRRLSSIVATGAVRAVSILITDGPLPNTPYHPR